MKIVQFGLPYSPNMGDGLISACLAHGIGRVAPHAEVVSVDLSGRKGAGETVVRNRTLALAILRHLPLGLRQRVVTARLSGVLDVAAQEWERALVGAELAVIGGGQLFSDADLNFPLKVARAADVAALSGVPLAIYAAGVAQNWTPRGTALFARVRSADLRAVGLRDGPSQAAWTAQMPDGAPPPQFMRDPGVLAAACYGSVAPDDRIALCVAAPEILRHHADGGVPTGGERQFEALARAILARGHALRLFCNGAAEDAAALSRLARRLSDCVADGRVEVAPVPATPEALVRGIASARAVIAHRLHACIVAFAYGRPVVGLGWDRKLESFLQSVDLADAFSPAEATVSDIVARLERVLEVGIAPARREAAEAEALDAITALIDVVGDRAA